MCTQMGRDARRGNYSSRTGQVTGRATVALILPFTQLNRLIRPEELADAICFMLANSAVSGELWADAGWHAPA